MTDFYLNHASGVTAFAVSTAYTSGAPGSRIVPELTDTGTNYAVARKWVWECTTSGTSDTVNPTWPSSVTQDVTTVTSGTATFTARMPGYSSGTTANWAFATIYGFYGLSCLVGADRLFAASTHADPGWPATPAFISVGTNTALAAILSVDASAAPPTALSAGASIGHAGGPVDVRGNAYCYGVDFFAQSGAGVPYLYLFKTNTDGLQVIDSCVVRNGGTATTGYLIIGKSDAAYDAITTVINTTVKLIATGQKISLVGVNWHGGGLAAGSSAVTTLFSGGTSPTTKPSLVTGFDASLASASVNLVATLNSCKLKMVNMKLPASWTGALAAGYPYVDGVIELINSISGTSYIIYRSVSGQGDIVDDTGIYLTTGYSKTKDLSNADVPYSLKISPRSTYVSRNAPLWTPKIPVWISSTGSKTLAIKVAYDSATALKDYELPILVTYAGTASSSHHSVAQSTTPTVQALGAGTSLTDTAEAWTGTSGWTNKKTHTISVTVTVNTVGYVYLQLGLANTQVVYVNRDVTVS